ncbi:IucA/IucC family protein [Pseudalkalibacillus sp. Hm43]|uniref:IucA/IucC family protein n=1 Tax=Pseudalkalibacillus sp. Hm43 TaxID=3450742 RepID=UPI003F43D8F9
MTIQLIQKPAVQKTSKESMLEEEVNCVKYVMKQKPAYVAHYFGNLERGRKGILHKLASAILREDINGLYSQAINLRKIGSALVITMNGEKELPDHFYNKIERYPFLEGMTYKIAQLQHSVLVFPIKNEFAYHRIETTDDILHISSEEMTTISVASDLLKVIYEGEEKPENLDAFISELDNGAANLTLAYMFDDVWKDEVQEEARHLGSESTMDYLSKKRETDASFSPSLFFEQLVLEGHHLHPGAKTKIGLSENDVFRYSPEFHQAFDVRFVAVEREWVVSTTPETKRLLDDFYPEELEQCLIELTERGYDPEQFDVIPVHEWQYENAIQTIYRDELETGKIILIENVTLKAEATSSFRTVYPKDRTKPALKLAVNSQMTSTVRSISTQTALNSTLFTEMMTSLMEKEVHLTNFIPLNEVAGAAFKSDEELKSRNLTMLMRESIEDQLQDEELAIAGPALYATSPITGKTILSELINQYAEENNLTKNRAAFPFFEDYITTVIPGYLTLMVKYGIALEGHLQNSIPVFKNGRLSRFFFRDWGGSRIYRERLNHQGMDISFTPGSISVTNDVNEMHNKLYYTVFQNHLGEIIRMLVQYSGIREEEFWKRVKKVCATTLRSLAAEKGLAENISQDEAFLYQPIVKHKSLTKMRLENGKGYSYSEVANPLHCADPSDD